MKASGIVRNIDELGRIVVPKEMRTSLGIQNGDSIEIYVDEDKIILKKHALPCIFCGRGEDLVDFKGKMICKSCKQEISEPAI